MKTRFIMMVALVTISTVLAAQSQEGKPGIKARERAGVMPMHHGQKGPLNGLNLTDEQKKAFKQSILDLQMKIQPIRNELGEAEAHQRTLMTAEKPDLKAINKNIERIGELRVEIAKMVATQRLELRAQLTDEQRLKFDMQMGKMDQFQRRKARQNR